MARRLFTALSVLSLVVFSITATMWIDSREAIVQWSYRVWSRPGDHFSQIVLAGSRGRVSIAWTTVEIHAGGMRESFHSAFPPGFQRTKGMPVPGLMDQWWKFQRYGTRNSYLDMSGWGALALAPAWLVIVVTLTAPVAWLFSLARRRWRIGENGCTACGYDLTGNTSGVCPECGTPTMTPKEQGSAFV